MRVRPRSALVVLVIVGVCQPAPGVIRDDVKVEGVRLLTLDPGDDTAVVRHQLQDWLDSGVRIALSGPLSMLDEIKPDDVHAWPSTNTIVLDPGAGLGIFGFDAADSAHRLGILRGWSWTDDGESSVRPRRSNDAGPSLPVPGVTFSAVTFDLSATSPSSACQAFRRKMTSLLFGSSRPSEDERAAFRKEIRRWCQYGNISVHQADTAQFSIEPFYSSLEPRLTMLAEWALLRKEDPIERGTTTYLFWVKTVGGGAGSGFSRRDGSEAYFDDIQGGLRRLLDASIHSGWAPLADDRLLTSWPVSSSFPDTGNIHIFMCDEPEGWRRLGCPQGVRLRSLYPADSTDGFVTVSLAERFIVGGSAQAGVSVDNAGKITPSFTFNLNLVQAKTETAQSNMQLAQTRTNADTVFHRTTRWTPDIPAIYRWIKARRHQGNLAQATPLASTLNPNYEVLWELPLKGNAGRKLSYHMVYEAGWNTCFNGPNCTTYLWPPDRTLPPKARIAWKDRLRLQIPKE